MRSLNLLGDHVIVPVVKLSDQREFPYLVDILDFLLNTPMQHLTLAEKLSQLQK